MRIKKALQRRRCLRWFIWNTLFHIKLRRPTAHSMQHSSQKLFGLAISSTYSFHYWLSDCHSVPIRSGLASDLGLLEPQLVVPAGASLPALHYNHCFFQRLQCWLCNWNFFESTDHWLDHCEIWVQQLSDSSAHELLPCMHGYQSQFMIRVPGSDIFDFQPWSRTTFGLLPMAASSAERVALLKERWLKVGDEEYPITPCASWGAW